MRTCDSLARMIALDPPFWITLLEITTEKPYFDISLEIMKHFGIKAVRNGYRITRIPNDSIYSATEITVEGDYSNASSLLPAPQALHPVHKDRQVPEKRITELAPGTEILLENNGSGTIY